MVKRGKLEIIRDMLLVIKKKGNSVKPTPLLRQSNLSSSSFKGYITEIIEKGFVREIEKDGEKFISLTDKGFKFLEKYKTIVEFIDEFEL
jgi:predicted transcriptional regulator